MTGTVPPISVVVPPIVAEATADIHFGLMLAGVLTGYTALLVAGVWQGVALDEPANSFAAVMKGTMMGVRLSTLGLLLLTLGVMAFLLNFALLLKGCCARCCRERAGGREMGKEGA